MDLIDRRAAIDALEEGFKDATEGVDKLSPTYGLIKAVTGIYKCLIGKLPPAQPETATVTIGRTKGGVTMWYECDACGEPVDQNDNYCRNCGRKLKHE